MDSDAHWIYIILCITRGYTERVAERFRMNTWPLKNSADEIFCINYGDFSGGHPKLVVSVVRKGTLTTIMDSCNLPSILHITLLEGTDVDPLK